MPKHCLWLGAMLFLLSPGLAGPALAEETPAIESAVSSADFPRFDSIRTNVEFWTRVFTEWSLGQVAVHDLDHPGVVYDVVDLPGPLEERYSEEQQEFIEDLNDLWKERLHRLEEKIRARAPLADEEKAWALEIATSAGSDKVEKAHERVRTQRGLRERFRRGLEISQRYDRLIREELRNAGVPEEIAYLPHVESSFQASARSSAGAVGVWQFTRGTGKTYLKIDSAVDERLDPIAAARGAARYLLDAHARLNSWPLALTAYNHGVAGMSKAVEKLGNDYERILREYDGRLFGFASKNFYSEFLAAMEIAREPRRFFPEGLTPEAPLDLDRIVLDCRATPEGIAQAHGIPSEELAGMNPAWSKRAMRSGLALPRGLTVWLPAGTLARAGGEARIPEAPAGEAGYHVVRKGQTLSSIAAKYGMEVGALRSLNGMQDNESLIRVGQKLWVDGDPGSKVHVVRNGDTLLRIALKHRVRLTALLDINQLSERSIIRPGQRIRIPSRN